MRTLALCIAVLMTATARAQDYAAPGPYAVGVRTVTVTRPEGTTFTARLSYPATSAGASTPFAPGAAPAAAISFGHGFLQATTQYATTMDHLASWGFVVIASNSQGSLFPSHAAFAADLRHSLTHLEQQNAASGSFLFSAVDVARFGMSGHSMGGGASILATADDPRVKALANLAAAETNPSATAAIPRIRVPVSLIAGESDGIVPVASNGQAMYNAAAAPKLLPIIRGGFHCGFTDAGFIGCDSSATLSRAQQLRTTRRLLTQFFVLTLTDDQSPWNAVWGPIADGDAAVNAAQRSPGSRMDAAISGVRGGPGSVVPVTLTVVNTSPVAMDFVLFAEGLGVSFEPASTGMLAPGASGSVTAALAFPAAASQVPPSVLISAGAANGRGARSFRSVATEWVCPADFDGGGGVDGDDVIAFFFAWDSSSASADVNADGGVDGDDVVLFFASWDAGC
ncbi:MAG: alpha/beta hydrolase family protein [Phycisphaerales bacterium]